MRSIAAFLAALLVLYAAGCDKSDNPVSHSETSTDVVLVVNSLGKTLSAIDFTQDVVLREVADLGNAPNQVVYKDKRVYVVNSLSNNIQVFKDTTLYPYPLLGTVSLGAGTNPMNTLLVDYSPNNHVNTVKGYVACLQSNSVLVYDPATYTVTATIPVGVGPTGIAQVQNQVYVTNTGFNVSDYSYGPGTISVIDPSTDAVVATIQVPKNPQSIAVAPDGMVHVACTGDYAATPGSIAVIDPNTRTVVDTIQIGGTPGAIAIGPDARAYVGMSFPSKVMVYDTRTRIVPDSTVNPLLSYGGSSIICRGTNDVFVAAFERDQVVRLDGSTGAVKRIYAVGDGPQSLAIK